MQRIILNRQSLLDMVIQECGSLDSIFSLAERNNMAITDDLPAGKELEYALEDITQKQVVISLANRGIQPATAISSELLANGELLLEGVEFWGIEYDFIVSGETGIVS